MTVRAAARSALIEDGIPRLEAVIGTIVTPDGPAIALDDPELQTAAASVARISGTAYACGMTLTGTGFVAAKDLVVTNAHVVAGVGSPVVELPGGWVTEGRIVYFDPVDDLVTTHHTLKVGRRTLGYTATTGRVVLREEEHKDGTFGGHKARAELSMTSYVLDDADARTRPVTFAFNGGPGSSSVWLHLGLLGPRRVVSGDVGALQPPPYDLVDNPESLLAVSRQS